MARDFFTMDDFELEDKTVIVRVDINSPIDPATGRFLDDTRIRRHSLTLKDLDISRTVVLAHQSRPGKKDFTTLKRHARKLSKVLKKDVRYIDDLFGSRAINAMRKLKAGNIILLENTRLFAEEIALAGKDLKVQANSFLVKRLAENADFYINDAFAAAHRSQPSLTGFVEHLPCLAGRVMEKELNVLSRVLEGNDRPCIAVLGGVKIDDSIDVATNMLNNGIADKILTTGLVANLFLMAKGYNLGKENKEFIAREFDNSKELLVKARKLISKFGDKIEVPSDLAVDDKGKRKGMPVEKVRKTVKDIGLDTIVSYCNDIRNAGTIVANGPAGVFEDDEFALGTVEIFKAIADSNAFSVLGGGHTTALAEKFGFSSKISHISTGGGACINFLAGKGLPAVESLKRSKEMYENGCYR